MSEEAPSGACGLDAQLDQRLVQAALALIEPARHILLIAHEHPDGDCIGSALGLARILELAGKSCVPACADPAPGNLSFLPGIQALRQTLDDEEFDLVIALDAGEFYRFGALYETHRAFFDNALVLNLDHHISSEGCGQINIIDPGSAATAELLVLFQQQARLALDRDAALCLLTGLITDTNSFQFTNTTPRCLEVAALLLRAGAIPETVVQPIYRTKPLAQVRFQSMILASAQTACEGRLIWAQATGTTLAAAGATPDMDENTSGMLRDIEGVQVAAYFKSYGDPTITRLSLRCAKPYNAADICQRLSSSIGNGQGGGHPRAAGATFHLPIAQTVEYVIAELMKEMQTTSYG
ncbi:MAG TPA: bifunctional oligoribonuclease/PAP phosphatase NrnA [Ktedonobacteraceae bacterium]|nr:bifunctional oligoribonuclease/PAP phosphatase NrnA [Ktedonobacteraceae bacterium]